jgi:[lysine-biosynthesis-protein LysW]--L-2-aminoadipate ligase
MAERTFAILASRVRVEEKQIIAALCRRSLPWRQVDTRELGIPLDGARRAGEIVLNREIGHTRATYAARALEACGTTVVNSAAASDVCGDKWRTSFALREAGVPIPRTALALTPDAALAMVEEIGYPAVFKPLVGSWGRLVTFVPDRRTAATVLEYIAALPSPLAHVVYVQEFVAKSERDLRVIVVGGEVLGATYRRNADWRTNVARGAVSERCELSSALASLAVAAADAVGAEIAGVDLVEDADGRLLVLEVNHRVEFAGFQEAFGDRVDVAERMVDHLLMRAAA